MSIFSLLGTIYAGKWAEKSCRNFTAEEVAEVTKAVVTSSDYGNSVCFYLKSGGLGYIPLSNTSTKGVGEEVDLTEAKIITLSKPGEADITRIDC
jgi:hypothetical protein